MDEACANVRVQLDSKPEVLDQLDRKIQRRGPPGGTLPRSRVWSGRFQLGGRLLSASV